VNQATHPVVGEARRGLVRLLVGLQQPAAVVAELAVRPAWLVDGSQVAIVTGRLQTYLERLGAVRHLALASDAGEVRTAIAAVRA
jgi:uncharacterized protein involved in type VI secretion and phage assembly